MNEKEIKELCKWLVENRKKQLGKEEKELIKQAIDASKNWDELLATVMSCCFLG